MAKIPRTRFLHLLAWKGTRLQVTLCAHCS